MLGFAHPWRPECKSKTVACGVEHVLSTGFIPWRTCIYSVAVCVAVCVAGIIHCRTCIYCMRVERYVDLVYQCTAASTRPPLHSLPLPLRPRYTQWAREPRNLMSIHHSLKPTSQYTTLYNLHVNTPLSETYMSIHHCLQPIFLFTTLKHYDTTLLPNFQTPKKSVNPITLPSKKRPINDALGAGARRVWAPPHKPHVFRHLLVFPVYHLR